MKEYWIVEPDQQLITIFKLGVDGKYSNIATYDEGEIKVDSLPGLVVDLNLVF